MVVAETITAIFVFLIALGALIKSFQEDVFGWPLIATVLFLGGMLYAPQIPFSVNGSGLVVPTGANKILTGVYLLFAVLSFLKCASYATDRLKMST